MIKKISVITVFLLIFCFISCANAGSDSSSGSENNPSEAEEVLNIDYFDEEFEITLRKKLN